MIAAKAKVAVDRFISGSASEFCCCPLLKRRSRFKSLPRLEEEKSDFLRPVTRMLLLSKT